MKRGATVVSVPPTETTYDVMAMDLQYGSTVARAQAAGRIDKKVVKSAAKMREVVQRSVRGPPPRNEALICAAGPNVSDL